MTQWMIYGANGYTGKMIAELAAQRRHKPILAGRGESVRTLAQELGLPCKVFDLADPAAAAAALQGVALVLNCAGPFSATAAPMIQACLKAGAHYLDITGEISVFEYAHSQHAAARERGVVVCPGVGFDVIPTDCVAAALKEALPDASELALGFDTASGLSPGTTKSLVEGMALGGKIRLNGRIDTVSFGYRHRRIDFGFGQKSATTISWGDVASAHYSTGIGNIEAYIPMPRMVVSISRCLNWTRSLLRQASVQAFLRRVVDKRVKGPDAEQRAKARTAVWGEVKNTRGEIRVARIETANGYQLTVDSALHMARHLLDKPPAAGGYFTPSMLCGWRLVEALPGSGKIVIQDGKSN
jgi:short subunit dehydrogenase-like uncharacterized protein